MIEHRAKALVEYAPLLARIAHRVILPEPQELPPRAEKVRDFIMGSPESGKKTFGCYTAAALNLCSLLLDLEEPMRLPTRREQYSMGAFVVFNGVTYMRTGFQSFTAQPGPRKKLRRSSVFGRPATEEEITAYILAVKDDSLLDRIIRTVDAEISQVVPCSECGEYPEDCGCDCEEDEED